MILVANIVQYLAKTVMFIAMILSRDVQSCKLTNVKYLDQHLVAEVLFVWTTEKEAGGMQTLLNDDGLEVPIIIHLCPLVVPWCWGEL